VRCLLLKARFISEDGLRAGTGGDFDRPLGSAPMRIGGPAPTGKGRHWNNVARPYPDRVFQTLSRDRTSRKIRASCSQQLIEIRDRIAESVLQLNLGTPIQFAVSEGYIWAALFRIVGR